MLLLFHLGLFLYQFFCPSCTIQIGTHHQPVRPVNFFVNSSVKLMLPVGAMLYKYLEDPFCIHLLLKSQLITLLSANSDEHFIGILIIRLFYRHQLFSCKRNRLLPRATLAATSPEAFLAVATRSEPSSVRKYKHQLQAIIFLSRLS